MSPPGPTKDSWTPPSQRATTAPAATQPKPFKRFRRKPITKLTSGTTAGCQTRRKISAATSTLLAISGQSECSSGKPTTSTTAQTLPPLNKQCQHGQNG